MGKKFIKFKYYGSDEVHTIENTPGDQYVISLFPFKTTDGRFSVDSNHFSSNFNQYHTPKSFDTLDEAIEYGIDLLNLNKVDRKRVRIYLDESFDLEGGEEIEPQKQTLSVDKLISRATAISEQSTGFANDLSKFRDEVQMK